MTTSDVQSGKGSDSKLRAGKAGKQASIKKMSPDEGSASETKSWTARAAPPPARYAACSLISTAPTWNSAGPGTRRHRHPALNGLGACGRLPQPGRTQRANARGIRMSHC
ncbi:hypothetical protein AU476_12615 [Cupriavidus sp. UYMSc13B]|nr:hypothetical protein AU476_12615 [Cupriavidus sp. UYMSc13B]